MTARHFIYRTMTGYAPLVNLIGGIDPRIFAKKSMTSSIEEHPYIVYKLGNETSEEFSEDRDISRQFFQVWVHDYSDGQTADYERIDEVLRQVRAAFFNANSAVDKVWTTRFLETSQDLNDETLNTVLRYARFQLIKEE